MTTNTISGVPCQKYGIVYTRKRPILLIKAPTLIVLVKGLQCYMTYGLRLHEELLAFFFWGGELAWKFDISGLLFV